VTPFFWCRTDLPTSLGLVKWQFWGNGSFSTHSSEKQPCTYVSGARRCPLLVGPSPWPGTFTCASQKSGEWLDALPLLPPSSREVQQHRTHSNNLSTLPAALPSSVLTVSNTSFSLEVWSKLTALHRPTSTMGHASCVQSPSTPVPLLWVSMQ